MSTRRTPAFAYLRVSGKGQVDGHGFPRQRAAIDRFARTHRYEIVEEFRDEGVSGTLELDHRAGLAALFDRLASADVRVVVVERADRLARDLMVGEVILSRFRARGVRVVAADSGADLTVGDDDPTRTLIRHVLGAVAQFEKSVLVQKLRAARDRASQQVGRRVEGRKAFGLLPGEADTAIRIAVLRRERRGRKPLSFKRIAVALNTEGRRTRSDIPWTWGTVRAVLRHRPLPR